LLLEIISDIDETSYIFSLICRGLIHQTHQFSGFINEVATKDAQLFMSFHINGVDEQEVFYIISKGEEKGEQ